MLAHSYRGPIDFGVPARAGVAGFYIFTLKKLPLYKPNRKKLPLLPRIAKNYYFWVDDSKSREISAEIELTLKLTTRAHLYMLTWQCGLFSLIRI